MALKHNVIANYVGQFYLMIIGIVMVPFYLRYLGDEAYGLVGFFALIQGWMILLDMGLSPTISREVSKVIGSENKKEIEQFKYLFHSIEAVFIVISLIISSSIIFMSDWISTSWLRVETLNIHSVSYSISLIGIMVGLRFFATLYKSGIVASEEQVWYNKASIILSTLKFVGVLFILKFISSDFQAFFEYQLIIFTLEFLVFSWKFYLIMDIKHFRFYFSIDAIKPIFKYAMSVAYTGAVWIFISQLDKLLLSGILTLKEYGYFALLGMITNAILQISAPINRAILPRMTRFYAEKKEKELFALYRKATQWISIIVLSVGGMVALYSYELLYAWTGNKEAASWGEQILFWYVLGNVLFTLASLQSYIQFAYGKLKMHLLYHSIVLFIFPPFVIWIAYAYNALGVSILWFIFITLSFFIWTPIVHQLFKKGMHKKWMLIDIFPIFLSTSIYVSLLILFPIHFSQNRILLFLSLLALGILLLSINFIISKASSSFEKAQY